MIMVVVINYGDLAHANGGCDGGDGDNDNGVAMMVVVSLLLIVNALVCRAQGWVTLDGDLDLGGES